MKHYNDLFIDFDDTLYDTYGNAVVALRELFEHFLWRRYFPDPQVFYDRYWESNVELWRRYSRGEISRDSLIVERFRSPLSYGEGINPTEAYCRQVSDVFLDYCSSKPGVVDGAHELVDYLLRRGYRLHLCSNGFHEVQYRKLKSCGMDGLFCHVILSEDAGANKPSKQFFDYALQVTGAQRETTLMIGDNFETDILGAKRAGLDVVYFNRFPDYPAPEPVNYEVTSLWQIQSIL